MPGTVGNDMLQKQKKHKRCLFLDSSSCGTCQGNNGSFALLSRVRFRGRGRTCSPRFVLAYKGIGHNRKELVSKREQAHSRKHTGSPGESLARTWQLQTRVSPGCSPPHGEPRPAQTQGRCCSPPLHTGAQGGHIQAQRLREAAKARPGTEAGGGCQGTSRHRGWGRLPGLLGETRGAPGFRVHSGDNDPFWVLQVTVPHTENGFHTATLHTSKQSK